MSILSTVFGRPTNPFKPKEPDRTQQGEWENPKTGEKISGARPSGWKPVDKQPEPKTEEKKIPVAVSGGSGGGQGTAYIPTSEKESMGGKKTIDIGGQTYNIKYATEGFFQHMDSGEYQNYVDDRNRIQTGTLTFVKTTTQENRKIVNFGEWNPFTSVYTNPYGDKQSIADFTGYNYSTKTYSDVSGFKYSMSPENAVALSPQLQVNIGKQIYESLPAYQQFRMHGKTMVSEGGFGYLASLFPKGSTPTEHVYATTYNYYVGKPSTWSKLGGFMSSPVGTFGTMLIGGGLLGTGGKILATFKGGKAIASLGTLGLGAVYGSTLVQRGVGSYQAMKMGQPEFAVEQGLRTGVELTGGIAGFKALGVKTESVSKSFNIENLKGYMTDKGVIVGKGAGTMTETINQREFFNLVRTDMKIDRSLGFMFKSVPEVSKVDVRFTGTGESTTTSDISILGRKVRTSAEKNPPNIFKGKSLGNMEGEVTSGTTISVVGSIEKNMKGNFEIKNIKKNIGFFKSRATGENIIAEMPKTNRMMTETTSESRSLSTYLTSKELNKMGKLKPELKGKMIGVGGKPIIPDVKTFKGMGQFKDVLGYVYRGEKTTPIFLRKEFFTGKGKLFGNTKIDIFKHEMLHKIYPELKEFEIRKLVKKLSFKETLQFAYGRPAEKLKLKRKLGDISISTGSSKGLFNIPFIGSGGGGKTKFSSSPSKGTLDSLTGGISTLEFPQNRKYPYRTFLTNKLNPYFSSKVGEKIGLAGVERLGYKGKSMTGTRSMTGMGFGSLNRLGSARGTSSRLGSMTGQKLMTGQQSRLQTGLKTSYRLGSMYGQRMSFGFTPTPFSFSGLKLPKSSSKRFKLPSFSMKQGRRRGLPISDLFDIESSFGRYGKVSFPYGKKIEMKFSQVMGNMGVFGRFPTYQQLKGGRIKI